MVKIYKENEIDDLSNILKNNGVISSPTDTVYGLCANIDSRVAYNKLIDIKGRPKSKAFPIMCSNIDQIKQIALVDEKIELFIKKLMPGPITIILHKKENLPDYITNNQDTIAIRMAPTSTLKNLIEKVDNPLFMTSANKSGESPCNNIEEIEKNFPNIDGIIDGKISFSKPSTIVDLTDNDIKIIREGPITIEDIYNKIGRK